MRSWRTNMKTWGKRLRWVTFCGRPSSARASRWPCWCGERRPSSSRTVRRGLAGRRHSGMLLLKPAQTWSLLEALRQVPDPRQANTRFRIGPLLTLLTMALLSGASNVAQIARLATRLHPKQRAALGLPIKKGTRRFYEVPSYQVFCHLLRRLDPEVLAVAVNAWRASQVQAPKRTSWLMPRGSARAGPPFAPIQRRPRASRRVGLDPPPRGPDGHRLSLCPPDRRDPKPAHHQAARPEQPGDALLPFQSGSRGAISRELGPPGSRPLGRGGEPQPLAARVLWNEDRTPGRHPHVVGNMAVLRGAALHLINRHFDDHSHCQARETLAANPPLSLLLLRSK